MKRLFAALLIVALLPGLFSCKRPKTKYTDYSFEYFDTVTTIVGYEESEKKFKEICAEIKALLKDYHQLYDIYKRYDGVINLCTVNDLHAGAHREVQVDPRLMELLVYARELYEGTNGKMNVAMGSVLSIWHRYRTDGSEHPEKAQLPPMDKLQEAAKHTDIQKMILNEEKGTVFLADPGMSLDVGAIAKGYATEQVALYLEEKGISGYLLNVGGNVRCVGDRPDGKGWAIGIENPDTEDAERPYVAQLRLAGKSLVTSGCYQRYYWVDGVRYHHIIDPDTLMPGMDFLSVSVLCTHSGRADALSTALFSMSFEEGKALIESLPDAEAMWVLPDGAQRYSSGFEAYCYE